MANRCTLAAIDSILIYNGEHNKSHLDLFIFLFFIFSSKLVFVLEMSSKNFYTIKASIPVGQG